MKFVESAYLFEGDDEEESDPGGCVVGPLDSDPSEQGLGGRPAIGEREKGLPLGRSSAGPPPPCRPPVGVGGGELPGGEGGDSAAGLLPDVHGGEDTGGGGGGGTGRVRSRRGVGVEFGELAEELIGGGFADALDVGHCCLHLFSLSLLLLFLVV